MSARADPEYMRLYKEYAKAIQGFENAVHDRRRVRNRLAVDSQPVLQILQDWMRRPVGAPWEARISALDPEPAPTPPPPPKPRRFYMGPILGWAKIIPTWPPATVEEPNVGIDVDKLYDRMSLHAYWNAKRHYEKCKRAFFDYVRGQNIDAHRERAKAELTHGTNLQMLGLDDDDPDFMEDAQAEVEAGCRNAWALYRSAGAEKSDEVKAMLLEWIAEAAFVGLESKTVKAMLEEFNRLVEVGAISN
jgi:hypothetical protein